MSGECIIFGGQKNAAGYGRQTIRGKRYVISRFVWEQIYGPIPAGMFVCHKCDNPSCCNIEHLFLGSAMDNKKDMMQKGRLRSARGEQQGLSKLKEKDIPFIRQSNLSQRKLAKIFGVTQKAIFRVKHKITWRHI